MSWDRWRTLLGLALLAFAVSGCGAKIVKINGELRKDGKPMIVSQDTYVTLSFIPVAANAESQLNSYNAKFDQKSGTYTVELPPGSYRTKLIIVPPSKSGGLSAPPRPIDSDKTYDLTKNQKLDIEVPVK